MAYRRGSNIIAFSPGFLPFTALFHLVLFAVRLFDWLVLGLRVKGRTHLRGVESAVLVSNHTLLLDPAVIAHAVRPKRTYFTMLEETAGIPCLGTFVRLLGGVPIPETSAAMRTLEAAARRAAQTVGLMHFFPEGECYRWSQELHPFQSGAFYLACRMDLPVLPLTTVLHERRWPACLPLRLGSRELRLPLRITVVIGEPVFPRQFSTSRAGMTARSRRQAAEAMTRYTRRVIQATIDRERGCKTLYRGPMPRLVRPGTGPAC